MMVLGLAATKGAEQATAMSMGAPQPQCTQCHVDAKERPAEFVVEGLPEEYVPGQEYEIKLRIVSGPECPEGASCGGFAITVSAGELVVVDEASTQIATGPQGEQMLTHTLEGARKREWVFVWRAPEARKEVTMSISVIAANGDGSFNGDAYGYREIVVKPAKPKPTPTPTPLVTVTTIVREIPETRTYTTVVASPVTVTEYNPVFAASVAVIAFAIVVAAYLAIARARG
jgi:hypothetical protein